MKCTFSAHYSGMGDLWNIPIRHDNAKMRERLLLEANRVYKLKRAQKRAYDESPEGQAEIRADRSAKNRRLQEENQQAVTNGDIAPHPYVCCEEVDIIKIGHGHFVVKCVKCADKSLESHHE